LFASFYSKLRSLPFIYLFQLLFNDDGGIDALSPSPSSSLITNHHSWSYSVPNVYDASVLDAIDYAHSKV
jgi:hypothetical protein